MLSIIQNEKPDLPICQMNCDGFLHEKLENYELTKFINTHSTNLIIGQPGSGKTSILYSFFKSKKVFKKVFHNIFLFRPSESAGSMKDDIFDTLPTHHKYTELTFENLRDCIGQIKSYGKDELNCIIFDDMGAYLKNNDTRKLFHELIFNRRHLHTSIFFLCQTYKSVHKDMRNLFSNMFIFKVGKAELDDIIKESISTRDKDGLSNAVIEEVFDKKYNFFFYNTTQNRMFKNWDEIKIID